MEHNFSLGAPARSREPMTIEQVRRAAPSAFAAEAYHEMSQRYAYVPTGDVIAGMISAGFQPFAASQSRARLEDKREHTKHMIRFRAPDAEMVVGGIYPEVVLINSHDGTSAYKLLAGMFRLVCSNGLVVSESMLGSVSIRHSGDIIDQVAEASTGLIERMPLALEAVNEWQHTDLSPDQAMAYAEAAHTVRFADAHGDIATPITPVQLLARRRRDDGGSDLWNTFNRVQENAIKGGLKALKPGSRRVTRTRQVNGISEDVRLNRALWTLTERMAQLVG